MAPEIRRLSGSASELDRADRLLEAAFGPPSRRRQLALYRACQPDGWFVLAERDTLIALAGALAYGSFCWLGYVVTDPAHRRRGLASMLSRHVLDWARAAGCSTVALDASDDARSLYERLGFRTVGTTVELAAPGGLARQEPARTGEATIDVDELLELDREAFGGDRARLLRELLADDGCLCRGLEDDQGLAGYLCVREHLLGPGCARDADSACELVRRSLRGRGDADTRLVVPMESGFLEPLLALGLRERRRLTHMRLGDPALPGRRDRLLAQTSFAAG